MWDNLSSVRVCNADILVSKDLAFSTILFSNDLAVASCDLINWDISSILELGRDCGVGPLLCLVSKATNSCSSSWPIKLKDCEAIGMNYYYIKTSEINALYNYANLNSQSRCPIDVLSLKPILPRKDYLRDQFSIK